MHDSLTLVVRALRSMELLAPLSVSQLQRLAEALRIVSLVLCAVWVGGRGWARA